MRQLATPLPLGDTEAPGHQAYAVSACRADDDVSLDRLDTRQPRRFPTFGPAAAILPLICLGYDHRNARRSAELGVALMGVGIAL